MNLYKGLLFLNGYLLDPRYADDAEPHYSEGYGNRVANARAFPKLGHARQSAAALPAPVPAEICPTGACG